MSNRPNNVEYIAEWLPILRARWAKYGVPEGRERFAAELAIFPVAPADLATIRANAERTQAAMDRLAYIPSDSEASE